MTNRLSSTTLALTKVQATGNDFLVLADLEARHGPAGSPTLSGPVRAALCDRRFGVGADGLIRIVAGEAGADCAMELTNADGGLAEISGNGLRGVALVADRIGLGRDDRLVVDTPAGRRRVDLHRDRAGTVVAATAEMGPVTFDPAEIPVAVESPFGLAASVDGVSYRGDAAGMGNPHLVVLVDDPDVVPLERVGPVLEHDERFPGRTNVEMVAVDGTGLRMRVWERGVGETLSCGSGACAAAAVARRRGLVPAATTVTVPGGVLTVEVGDRLRLGGPVAAVFETTVDLECLEAGRPAAGTGRGAGAGGAAAGAVAS